MPFVQPKIKPNMSKNPSSKWQHTVSLKISPSKNRDALLRSNAGGA